MDRRAKAADLLDEIEDVLGSPRCRSTGRSRAGRLVSVPILRERKVHSSAPIGNHPAPVRVTGLMISAGEPADPSRSKLRDGELIEAAGDCFDRDACNGD